MDITGGARKGNNLFHSFEEFSIPTGESATFLFDTDVENIFIRVTGSVASNIDGMLKAQSNANLFLINPKGIVFGEQASLDLGGSFVGSTANSIEFADRNKFTVSDTKLEPVLTASVPVGLEFTGNEKGAIAVNAQGNQIETESLTKPIEIKTDSSGLAVNSSKTLALVGGKVNLAGGIVTAKSGRIEIGSVAVGSVRLENGDRGLKLNYDQVQRFDNIQLRQQALVNASGTGEGFIQVNADKICLAEGSKILLQNQGKTQPGNLQINAVDSLTLEGKSSKGIGSGVQTETVSSGQTADLAINTQKIVLKDAARIGANTYSDGKGGNIVIKASDSIEIIGDRANMIHASSYVSGEAGNISISTDRLVINDGGGISSTTLGTGKGGNISVNADLIELTGVINEQNTPSSIAALAIGNSKSGNAGAIEVNTSKLTILEGATVNTSSAGDSPAGNIIINASNSVEVSGVKGNFMSVIGSSVLNLGSEAERNRRGLPSLPSGVAGSVTINTPNLNINSRGSLSVGNQGTGDAGNLTIKAESINLDDRSNINADAVQGKAGKIEIIANSRSNLETISIGQLRLQNKAKISAAAYGHASSGKITLNASKSLQILNSNISASSYAQGDAGSIDIATPQLLVTDGGVVTASTIGTGIAGEVAIDADLVEVIGVSSQNGKYQRSNISASSFNLGKAGILKINTAQLRVKDGGSVSSSAFATGDAGSLTMNASKAIEVTGISHNFASRIGAAVEFTVTEAARKALKLPEIPSGCSGNIEVNTPNLNINSRGSLSVGNQGTGNAGNLTIKAESINLDDRSNISADAVGGKAGKIEIQVKHLSDSALNQITAKSESGIDGEVSLN